MALKCVSAPLNICKRAQNPAGKDRGSALLLTVGLLAILAMLGSTFLLISRMNRKQCVAIASKAPVEPLASGIASQIKESLKRDLYLSDTAGEGPYNATKMGADGATPQQKWQRFIDYPMKCSSATVMARDYWLTDISTAGGHVSNLYKSCTTTYSTSDADVDGDGTPDSKEEDSGVCNEVGGTYHVAVRVVDTSGLICCNTACRGGTADLTRPVCPVNVSLSDFLTSTIFARVRAERGGGTIGNYNANCALYLLNPTEAYSPFAIGDEMYLRWLKSGAQVNTGRLFDATETDGAPLVAATRKGMTTFSCVRSLVRYPDATLKVRLALDKNAVCNDGRGLGNAAQRQGLYEKLKVIMGDDKKAAHVVANAWAYADGMDPSKDYAFPETTPTVYGVKPQVVITEAFARHQRNGLVAPQDDSAYGYAIEVYNPTNQSISFTIKYPGGNTSSESVGATSRKVFYNFAKGDDSTETETAFFSVASIAGWVKKTDLDFSGGADRKVQLLGGTDDNIPIDEVSSDDLGYTLANSTLPITTADEARNIRRDDLKGRYNVAIYNDTATTGANLGAANGDVFSGDTSTCCEGFTINKPGVSGLVNLGELLNIYLVGPEKDGDSLPKQLAATYATSISRGRLNYASDSTVSASAEYPNTIACGALLGELFEAVPVDTLRDTTTSPPASRTYGKININTAPLEVLKHLPFAMYDHEGTAVTPDAATVAQKIIDYRTAHDGFMTPGEVVIPLADYAATLLSVTEKQTGYLEACNSLYSSISNLISVNSDTFVANVMITMKDAGADKSWNYVIFIDRSNCWDSNDDPAILLFSPVK